MAYIIQNPGKKTKVAILIKGIQGAGKNRFTDIFSELLSGYSRPNVTDLEKLIGKYNTIIENCKFMVLNEIAQAREDYYITNQKMKSYITDYDVDVEGKYEPIRRSDNVCNFVLLSNNSKPIRLEMGDRRYLVLNANGKYSNLACDKEANKSFFSPLYHLDNAFYNNLLTYLMKRDISKFDPFNDYPETQEKKILQAGTCSLIEDFLRENYDAILEGVSASELKQLYSNSEIYFDCITKPNYYKKTFIIELLQKCDYKSKRFNGTPRKVYVMKPEYEKVFKPVDFETSDEQE